MYHFAFSPAKHDGPSLSTSQPALGTTGLFFNYLHRLTGFSYCGFDLNFCSSNPGEGNWREEDGQFTATLVVLQTLWYFVVLQTLIFFLSLPSATYFSESLCYLFIATYKLPKTLKLKMHIYDLTASVG